MQGEWNCSIEMEYSSMLHDHELHGPRKQLSKQRLMSSCTCRRMIVDGFL